MLIKEFLKDIKRECIKEKIQKKEISHGGCQVNGPKVAKFLDR